MKTNPRKKRKMKSSSRFVSAHPGYAGSSVAVMSDDGLSNVDVDSIHRTFKTDGYVGCSLLQMAYALRHLE